MTKATMPEPVAWRTGIDLFRTESAAHLNLRNPDLTPEPLITTTQAEAYADAVTREATAQASEALKSMRAYLSKCPRHAEDRTGAEWGRMMDLSGAALAKAEGKS